MILKYFSKNTAWEPRVIVCKRVLEMGFHRYKREQSSKQKAGVETFLTFVTRDSSLQKVCFNFSRSQNLGWVNFISALSVHAQRKLHGLCSAFIHFLLWMLLLVHLAWPLRRGSLHEASSPHRVLCKCCPAAVIFQMTAQKRAVCLSAQWLRVLCVERNCCKM